MIVRSGEKFFVNARNLQAEGAGENVVYVQWSVDGKGYLLLNNRLRRPTTTEFVRSCEIFGDDLHRLLSIMAGINVPHSVVTEIRAKYRALKMDLL